MFKFFFLSRCLLLFYALAFGQCEKARQVLQPTRHQSTRISWWRNPRIPLVEKSQDCCIPHVHLPISSFCHLCIISIPIFFYFFTFCPLSNMNRIKVIQYHPILHGAIMRIFPIELKYKSQHMCDWDLLTDMIHKKYSRSIT